MQAPGDRVKDLLSFTFWVFYYHHCELRLRGEFNLWSDSDAFQEWWWGAHLPTRALPVLAGVIRASGLLRVRGVLRHQRDAGDSLLQFYAASDITYTDGSDDPLMYGTAESLAAQRTDKCRSTEHWEHWEHWVLFALLCVPAHSEKESVGAPHRPPPPPPLHFSVTLWKSCVTSWKCESPPAASRSRASKEDLVGLYMKVAGW